MDLIPTIGMVKWIWESIPPMPIYICSHFKDVNIWYERFESSGATIYTIVKAEIKKYWDSKEGLRHLFASFLVFCSFNVVEKGILRIEHFRCG
jgi:hypothetical protein